MSGQIKRISKERAREIVDKGMAWYKKLGSGFEKSHQGQYIIIDVETGNYVVSDDDVKIDDEFQKICGSGRAAFHRRIGEPYPYIRV